MRWHYDSIPQHVGDIGVRELTAVTSRKGGQVGRCSEWVRGRASSLQIIPMADGAIVFVQLSTRRGIRGSNRLHGFQVLQEILDPHISPVHIRFNLMKDGSPNRHLSGSVCHRNFIAHDHLAYPCRRELPSIITGQESQIGYFGLQRGRCRTPSVSIHAMAGGTIGPEQVRPFDRANQRRKLLSYIRRRLILLADSGEGNSDERKPQYDLQGPLESFVRRLHSSLLVISAYPKFHPMHYRSAFKGLQVTPSGSGELSATTGELLIPHRSL